MKANREMQAEPNETARVVEVCTGSRLHFGLFAFGRSEGRQYGGVGLMLEAPSLRLRLEQASGFDAGHLLAERITKSAQSCRRHFGHSQLPNCRVTVVDAPPQHVGFGSGTQLGSAVAAGLAAWYGKAIETGDELAIASDRAVRSAVGTYGFLLGGMIVDGGKSNTESAGELQARVAFPDDWRVLLIWPREIRSGTMSGTTESTAFRDMPAVSPEREATLRTLATDEIVPAVESCEFDRFADALYRYNHAAGECYRLHQGGAYAGEQVANTIGTCREIGMVGVGQSSWGPLVFAMARSSDEASRWQQALIDLDKENKLHINVAHARNVPARIVDTGRGERI